MTKPKFESGIFIPTTAFYESNLEIEDRMETFNMSHALCMVKSEMDAEDVLALLNDLHALEERLLDSLDEACGPCKEICAEECPLQESSCFGGILLERGLCLGRLNRLLRSGEIVYGND